MRSEHRQSAGSEQLVQGGGMPCEEFAGSTVWLNTGRRQRKPLASFLRHSPFARFCLTSRRREPRDGERSSWPTEGSCVTGETPV